MLGGLDFGPRRGVPAIAALLAAAGVPHELLPADEAAALAGHAIRGRRRLPPAGGHAGFGRARSSAFVALAAGRRGGRAVRLAGGRRCRRPGVVGLAPAVPLSAGLRRRRRRRLGRPLLSSVVALPPMRVTQQQIFHFPRLRSGAAAVAVGDPRVGDERGVPPGRRARRRPGGRSQDRRARRRHAVHRGDRVRGRRCRSRARGSSSYVTRWLPGLAPEPRSETTCLYTETPSEDFILDRVGPVVVCSPCSGHGAKFAPLIGELVAGLLDGWPRCRRASGWPRTCRRASVRCRCRH